MAYRLKRRSEFEVPQTAARSIGQEAGRGYRAPLNDWNGGKLRFLGNHELPHICRTTAANCRSGEAGAAVTGNPLKGVSLTTSAAAPQPSQLTAAGFASATPLPLTQSARVGV